MSRSRVNPIYTDRVGHYVSRHADFAAARRDDPGWLVDLRAQTLARFAEVGFPSPRLEEWRYTNVAAIAKLSLDLPEGGCEPRLDDGGQAHTLSFAEALRQAPDALRAGLGSCLDPKDRGFALLNTAFLAAGAWVRVPENACPEAPIHLRFDAPGPGAVCHPRVLVEAEPGSRAVVVLDHAGEGAGAGLTNLVAEIRVGANASLDLVLVQREGDAHFHVSNLACRVARDGRFTAHTLTASGALVRNDLDVVLEGEGAECDLRGLFLGSGSRLVDNHTSVDHAVPHCTSRELYKGILGGRSRGVFRGRVLVRPDAQKTDASQSNPNLLIGESAEIDTKPQLEIYADDVKCSHGATVGQLEEDALFYLRSRGIGRDDARNLLILAFASEITSALPGEELATRLGEAMSEGLRLTLSADAKSAPRSENPS